MADPSIVREWLAKAEEDFRFAESNLRETGGFYAQICFHFQQAAEKYLKAFIIGKGLPFERAHDLVLLLKICSADTPDFSALKEDCILLNTAYIEARYPVHWPVEYTRETAERAHLAASRIADSIRDALGV